jgi:hypothetical protein
MMAQRLHVRQAFSAMVTQLLEARRRSQCRWHHAWKVQERIQKKIPKKDVMSTKTPKTYKGTNITPTKLQKDRMRKRAMGST